MRLFVPLGKEFGVLYFYATSALYEVMYISNVFCQEIIKRNPRTCVVSSNWDWLWSHSKMFLLNLGIQQEGLEMMHINFPHLNSSPICSPSMFYNLGQHAVMPQSWGCRDSSIIWWSVLLCLFWRKNPLCGRKTAILYVFFLLCECSFSC